VFVECTGTMDDSASKREVAWVSALAERNERIRGIVAHASLESGAAVYEHLAWLTARPLVRGVRRLLQAEPDAEFCLRPRFVDGVRMLAEFGLSFDACIYHHQLPGLVRLVEKCPEVQFVLDHMGKPAIREGKMDPWREHTQSLASLENVVCKISGAVTEADHDDWTCDQVLPYLEFAMEVFGPERIMFGGDWPVLRLAASYPDWIKLARRSATQMNEDDQKKMFRSNAVRVYRLSA